MCRRYVLALALATALIFTLAGAALLLLDSNAGDNREARIDQLASTLANQLYSENGTLACQSLEPNSGVTFFSEEFPSIPAEDRVELGQRMEDKLRELCAVTPTCDVPTPSDSDITVVTVCG